jgi:hypothetical protein
MYLWKINDFTYLLSFMAVECIEGTCDKLMMAVTHCIRVYLTELWENNDGTYWLVSFHSIQVNFIHL